MASNNMYRVGDFVYFESSATAPYQIRRIDELNKTSTGAVEAKVACYFRRRDVSIALINQAEKYYVDDTDSDEDSPDTNSEPNAVSGSNKRSGSGLTDLDKHRIKHRELFLSRETELLPATHIRGKCSVTLYNDVEPLNNYLAREDAFYYKLIYDPMSKTLQEDRGAMRIGSDHQSEIQPLLKDSETDPRFSSELEELVWRPDALTDGEVDMFCLLARAVGTLGRAYDPSYSARQPLLLGAAAAAGRDITKQYAHDLLHKANYDIPKAISLLVPGGQPIVCRDQLEEWSPNEAHLFEEALDKYSKVFPDILSDYLSWKTPKALIELYYYWKTTDRYVRQRRTKLAAQEHKLKQVYIPNYSKPNPSVLYNGSDKTGRGCEGCAATSSSQWYAWGPQNLSYRLCSTCWTYWKRYGGLKSLVPKERAPAATRGHQSSASSLTPSVSSSDNKPVDILGSCSFPTVVGSVSSSPTPNTLIRYADGVGLPAVLAGGPRGTQCFKTPSVIRLARILCPHLVRPVLLARRPSKHASTTASKKTTNSPETISFSTLLRVAQPILARLPNPLSLLSHMRSMPPVNDVIAALASRKGIKLPHSMELGSSIPNGPTLVTKRTRSPSGQSVRNTLNGTEQANSSGTNDLVVNGDKSTESGSPPPCKKPAIGLCVSSTDTSNGLVVHSCDTDRRNELEDQSQHQS